MEVEGGRRGGGEEGRRGGGGGEGRGGRDGETDGGAMGKHEYEEREENKVVFIICIAPRSSQSARSKKTKIWVFAFESERRKYIYSQPPTTSIIYSNPPPGIKTTPVISQHNNPNAEKNPTHA